MLGIQAGQRDEEEPSTDSQRERVWYHYELGPVTAIETSASSKTFYPEI